MIVTKVTMNNLTLCLSHHDAAMVAVMVKAALAAADPSEMEEAGKVTSEKYEMELGALDVIASCMSFERVVDRTLAGLLKLVKSFNAARQDEEFEDEPTTKKIVH